MAQRVVTVLISDLSGEELTESQSESVTFGLDNARYEIDLSKPEAAEFRSLLERYTSAGRRVGRSSGTAGRRTQLNPGGSGMSREELGRIRAWAAENGYKVSSRGRIAQSVVDAYHAAQ